MAISFPKSKQICTEVGARLQDEEWKLQKKNRRTKMKALTA
jgi:hypothetical protein